MHGSWEGDCAFRVVHSTVNQYYFLFFLSTFEMRHFLLYLKIWKNAYFMQMLNKNR